VFERATQLDLQSDIRGFNLKSIANGEKIDRDCSEQTYAERLTRNAEIDQRGHQIHQASMMVAFWKIKMSEIKNARDFRQKLKHSCDKLTGQIHRLKHRHLWKYVPNSEVRKKIRTIRKQANKHRSKFLQERAAAEALGQPSSTSASTTRES
jgi:hypothetical protein